MKQNAANNRTELVFILDRSGSMGGLESDTIGGFNAMLKQQKAEEGEAVVTTVLFDDQYQLLHDRIPVQAVAPITTGDYFVRGCTALLDAVGTTVEKIAQAQQNTAPGYRAGKVLFVITTDGMENASRHYTYAGIKELVERQQREHGWEFLFLGANIDAGEAASKVGIPRDNSVNYHADSQGVQLNYEAVSAAACQVRTGKSISPQWKEAIQADFEQRPGN